MKTIAAVVLALTMGTGAPAAAARIFPPSGMIEGGPYMFSNGSGFTLEGSGESLDSNAGGPLGYDWSYSLPGSANQIHLTDQAIYNVPADYFGNNLPLGYSIDLFFTVSEGDLSNRYSTFATQIAPPVASVPESASWAMMIVGLGAVGGIMRRARKSDKSFTVKLRAAALA